MIYYDTVKRQLTQQELDGNFEQLMLRAKRLGAQDMPITLRKDLTRPLTPREMDTNFQSLDLAVKKARYGDGPYPAAEYIFDGATVLPAGITFTRSGTATYIKNGRILTAGVDEPVFERGGLRVWTSVTNLYPSNNSLVADSNTNVGMDVSAAASIFEGKEAALYTTNGGYHDTPYSFSPPMSLDTTKEYTHSIVVEVITNEDVLVRLRGEKGSSIFYVSWTGDKESLALMDGVDVISNRGPNAGVVMRFSAPVEPEADRVRFLVHIDVEADVVGEQVAVHHYQIEEGDTVGPMVWTDGQPETMPADNASIQGAAFQQIFNPNQGALVFKIGEWSALPYLGGTAPYYAAALFTNTGTISDNLPGAGVYFTSSASGFWRGVGVRVPNKARHNNAIIHNMHPGDTIGLSWAGNTINLYVNGQKRGEFTHEDVGEALQAVERFHIHDDQAMYLDTLSLFGTAPTDEQMEALTNA